MLISHDMKNTQNQKIVFPQLNVDCVIKVIDCISGDSFVPQSSGEIELPLHLELGDASLFEVFAQPASDPDQLVWYAVTQGLQGVRQNPVISDDLL